MQIGFVNYTLDQSNHSQNPGQNRTRPSHGVRNGRTRV